MKKLKEKLSSKFKSVEEKDNKIIFRTFYKNGNQKQWYSIYEVENEEFKVLCVRTKFSLQKLVDRSMYLYLTNDDYKKQLHNTTNLSLSGSQQS